MHEVGDISLTLIVPAGTQVVVCASIFDPATQGEVPKGAVGEIVKTPADGTHSYRIRLVDGNELSIRRREFTILKQMKTGPIGNPSDLVPEADLRQYVIYRCIVGSRAYGLSHDDSDTDRRGIYLPPAELEWSLYGVPEQLDIRETDECYWELQKFITLALKANPNILECLFTPLVEQSSEIGDALLAARTVFLSKLVYQTYNGYVMSQFKKLEQDLRTKEQINWKHAMHLIRLLLQGIEVLSEGRLLVEVSTHRDRLLAVRHGRESWTSVNQWRLALHREFEQAFRVTELPDSPGYAEANRLLIWARRRMVEMNLDSR